MKTIKYIIKLLLNIILLSLFGDGLTILSLTHWSLDDLSNFEAQLEFQTPEVQLEWQNHNALMEALEAEIENQQVQQATQDEAHQQHVNYLNWYIHTDYINDVSIYIETVEESDEDIINTPKIDTVIDEMVNIPEIDNNNNNTNTEINTEINKNKTIKNLTTDAVSTNL